MRVAAIIPAYNEASRVANIVKNTAAHVDTVIVVDDGSSDGTAEEARKAGAVVLKLPVNVGYGGALQTGYRYIVRHGFDAVVQLDADGQHDPLDIPVLLNPIIGGRCDLTLGSRFLNPSSWKPGLSKKIGMRFFSSMIKIFTGKAITDPTTGFQAMNLHVIERVAGGAFPDDFPDADVIVMLLRENFRIEEIGVAMKPPPAGKRMHSGLTPIYYVIKMTLSVLVVMLRSVSRGGKQ